MSNNIKVKAIVHRGIDPVIVEVSSLPPEISGRRIMGADPERGEEVLRRVAYAMNASGCTALKAEAIQAHLGAGMTWAENDRRFDRSLLIDLSPQPDRLGTSFDLAIAVAILSRWGIIPATSTEGSAFVGELSLDGSVRPVGGAIVAALGARSAGIARLYIAEGAAGEAAVIPGVEIMPVRTLTALIDHLNGRLAIQPEIRPASAPTEDSPPPYVDLSSMRGAYAARRALEIAAAGGHHLFMVGPPGCGKTLLARALPGILPPMTEEEVIETARIHSVAGMPRPGGSGRLLRSRPFRAPHCTSSEAALVGGGYPMAPGEVSLAHNGVLYLDEAPEFRRASVDALSGAVKDGASQIYRGHTVARIPARPLIVAAADPCACRIVGGQCRCTAAQKRAYQARLPLRDMVDVFVLLPRPLARASSSQSEEPEAESSAVVRARVVAAREIQAKRNVINGVSYLNAELPEDLPADVRSVTIPASSERALLAMVAKLGASLSVKPSRIMRVARTIADLAGESEVLMSHLSEAVSLQFPGAMTEAPTIGWEEVTL